MITIPAVLLVVDEPSGAYQPGDELTGRFLIEGTKPWEVRAAELSVLWYTAGKGEEDMAVHHFERLVDEPAVPLDLRLPRTFSTKLPLSPLSYEGQIVKVCWCARVRLFLPHGQTTVAETAFRLGSVPAATSGEPTAETAQPEV
jgi:hypothetical protein